MWSSECHIFGRYFCGSFVFLYLVFLMLLHLVIAAVWLPAGKGLTSCLLLVMFIVFLLLSRVVSWVRCGTSLYRFLIFAFFLTMKINRFAYKSTYMYNLKIPSAVNYEYTFKVKLIQYYQLSITNLFLG